MSSPPEVRRVDKVMTDARARETLAGGFCGRLGTVGPDGWPYVVPILYVWMEGQIYVHNSRAPGHLRRNVDDNPRVCFEVDEPGPVFAYGRFECDTSIAYKSVIAFGTFRIVEPLEDKAVITERRVRLALGRRGRCSVVTPWRQRRGKWWTCTAIPMVASWPSAPRR